VGAKLVVLDVAFRNARNEAEDAALETAIAKAKNVLLFTYLKREQWPTPSGTLDIHRVMPPLKRFAQHALGSGSFTLPKERTVQHTLLSTPDGQTPVQPVLVAKHWGKGSAIRPSTPYFINYYGPAFHLNNLGVDQLLQRPAQELVHLKNKVIYIGLAETVQTEQQDTYPTVFTKRFGIELSGVEISATVASNIMDGSLLTAPKIVQRVLLVSLTIALLVTAYCVKPTILVATSIASLIQPPQALQYWR